MGGFDRPGKKLFFEYPHETPSGVQMDFAEVIDLNRGGLIEHHRVYCGGNGFGVLQRDEYHK